MQSVWDYLLFTARLRPHEVAVMAPRGPVTRAVLVEEVAGLATELLTQGIAGQKMIGLALGTSYLHLLMILALDRLNLPSTSLTLPQTADGLRGLIAACGITTLIAKDAAPADAPCRWLQVAEEDRPKIGRPDRARLLAVPRPDDALLRVIWSSGTTGGAKGVALTRDKQMLRLPLGRALRGHSPGTRHFVAMSFATIYGYNVSLAVLMAGGMLVLPMQGGDFFALAKALGVNSMGTNVPMLSELLGREPQAMRRLEGVQIEVMGSHLPPQLAQQVRSLLTPNLVSTYGTSEAGTIAMGDAGLCIADAAAVGYLVPTIEAEIVDDAGSAQPHGAEGILRLRGPQLVTDYYGLDAASAPTVHDGWFYPGDVATIGDDGLLRITGRAADTARIGDRMVAPLPIETVLAALPGVREAAVFALAGAPGGSDQLCAAVVIEPGTDLATLRAAAQARLGVNAPARLLALDALPRSPNGKVLKRELLALARARLAGAPESIA